MSIEMPFDVQSAKDLGVSIDDVRQARKEIVDKVKERCPHMARNDDDVIYKWYLKKVALNEDPLD